MRASTPGDQRRQFASLGVEEERRGKKTRGEEQL